MNVKKLIFVTRWLLVTILWVLMSVNAMKDILWLMTSLPV